MLLSGAYRSPEDIGVQPQDGPSSHTISLTYLPKRYLLLKGSYSIISINWCGLDFEGRCVNANEAH